MSSYPFQVRPLPHYDLARYPSTYLRRQPGNPPPNRAPDPTADDDDEPGPGPLVTLGVGILVLGMAIGLIACFGDEHSVDLPRRPDIPTGSFGPDGPNRLCSPDQVWCEGQNAVIFCNEDGLGTTRYDCDDYCVETLSSEYYSTGCDAAAADPCQCEYGVVDGEPVECAPGDAYCADPATAMVCDGFSFTPVVCQDYCQETFGEEYYAVGCDTEIGDHPCQCEYGIIDGDWAECTPGDVYCASESLAMVCKDGITYSEVDCAEECSADAPAAICNPDNDPPCDCD